VTTYLPKSERVTALFDAIPRPGELHLTAYLWGNGQGEASKYEQLKKYSPILAHAAEAHRVGDRLQFVNFCWQSEEVKQVWHDNRQEYDLLAQLFGNNALEVKTGRGEYPKPPAREGEAQIKGTLCTLHKRGNESKAVVQPIFPRDYKTDKREYHLFVVIHCLLYSAMIQLRLYQPSACLPFLYSPAPQNISGRLAVSLSLP